MALNFDGNGSHGLTLGWWARGMAKPARERKGKPLTEDHVFQEVGIVRGASQSLDGVGRNGGRKGGEAKEHGEERGRNLREERSKGQREKTMVQGPQRLRGGSKRGGRNGEDRGSGESVRGSRRATGEVNKKGGRS